MDDLADAARHAAYKKAIDDALAADIGDVELWLLRGNAEEPTAAGRGQRGGVGSVAFYERALRLQPDNGAAHHYLTHSFETIGQIPAALEHGEVYAGIAPAIPHSHHMWGHDLRRVGRIDDAIAAFRRTDELERAYYAAENISPELDWHHVHNLDLLATAYQYKGQMRLAEETLRETAAFPPVTDYLEFNQKTLASFLLDRGRAEEALAAARKLCRRPLGLRTRGGPVRWKARPSWPSAAGTKAARRSRPRSGSWPRCRRSAAGSPSPAAPRSRGSTRCAARSCCARATPRKVARS